MSRTPTFALGLYDPAHVEKETRRLIYEMQFIRCIENFHAQRKLPLKHF